MCLARLNVAIFNEIWFYQFDTGNYIASCLFRSQCFSSLINSNLCKIFCCCFFCFVSFFGWQKNKSLKCNKSKLYSNTHVFHYDFSKWVPSSYHRVCNCKHRAKCSLSLPCTSLWFLSERASPFHAAFVTRCVTSFFDRGTPRQQQWQLQTWLLCHYSSSSHHWIALVCQRFFKFALECISKVRRLFYLNCARLFSVLIR